MVFQLTNPAIAAKGHLSVNQNESREYNNYKDQNSTFCKILINNLFITNNTVFRRSENGKTGKLINYN